MVRDLCLLLLLFGCTASLRAVEPVTVELHGDIGKSTGELVRIGDVAEVFGGTATLRRRIAQLDIARARDVAAGTAISPQQVKMRILLAGIRQTQFRLTGTPSSPVASASNDQVLDRFVPSVARQLGVVPSEVQLRLARALSPQVRSALNSLRGEIELPRTLGSAPFAAKVRLYDERGRFQQPVTVTMEVRVIQHVLVTKAAQRRGATLSDSDVRSERRFVAPNTALATLTDLQTLGVVRRDVSTGQILQLDDFQTAAKQRRQVVVRARDVVDVIARKKSLQVTINGVVAMESGAVGETIRVKNPHNQDPRKAKIFTARVVDVGLVEVRL